MRRLLRILASAWEALLFWLDRMLFLLERYFFRRAARRMAREWWRHATRPNWEAA